jgi:hypothetical protein
MSFIPHLFQRAPTTALLQSLYPRAEDLQVAADELKGVAALLAQGAEPNEAGLYRRRRLGHGPVGIFTQHRATPLEFACLLLQTNLPYARPPTPGLPAVIAAIHTLLEGGAFPTYRATERILATAVQALYRAPSQGAVLALYTPPDTFDTVLEGFQRAGAPWEAPFSRSTLGLPAGTTPKDLEVSGWHALAAIRPALAERFEHERQAWHLRTALAETTPAPTASRRRPRM